MSTHAAEVLGARDNTDGFARFIDRWIWVFMATLFITAVLAGFIPDSISMVQDILAHESPPFPWFLHIHAVVMGSWMLVLLALALYPHVTDAQAKQAAADILVRDSDLGWNAWAWASLYVRHGSSPVYLYYFDRRSPQAPRGPTHNDEISYVFGNWISSLNDTPFPPGGAQPSDLELSDRIQGYWVNFAKSGNPNGPGLPPWPAFTASSQQALYLDDQPHAGPVPNLKQIRAIEAHYAQGRKGKP